MAAILSPYSTTGFYAAPVSKGLLGSVFLTSCALNVPLFSHLKPHLVYSPASILHHCQLWRLLTAKLTFLDTKQLVCGCLLIYYFRIFERRYGSHKFASYLLAAFTVASLLELSVVAALQHAGLAPPPLPSGPFSLVVPLFVNYFLDIPRVTQSHFMGVPLTGKTFTYLLGLQLLCSSKGAFLLGLCSLVAGVVIRWPRVRQVVAVPKVVARLSGATLGWLLRSAPPAPLEPSHQPRQQMAQGYAERLVYSHHNSSGDWGPPPFLTHRPTGGLGPAEEEQVRTLVEMGFDRQSVVRALRNANNDVHAATTILLAEA